MIRHFARLKLTILALVVATASVALYGQPAKPRRIAVFGSSVANGTGDELGQEGYTGRLRTMLSGRGWEVLNQSRGGDNTLRMAPRFEPVGPPDPNTRYLLPVKPTYVLLGLSLGNEGIRNGVSEAEKDAIFNQFEAGMKGFVARSRQNGIVPIITLCYTRNDFTELEYRYTRRMNLLINGWDVPSVNFLGAVDDGAGKWARGFWFDSLHPNASGHDELTSTFVPSLFEALEQDKPLPVKSTAPGFARTLGGMLTFDAGPSPGDRPMHPFALVVTVRTEYTNASIATVSGMTLNATTAVKKIDRGSRGAVEIESTSLTESSRFTASVGVSGGLWSYTAADGSTVVSDVKAGSQWHQVVISHYTARGETLFSVDGRLAGSVRERLQPDNLTLIGPAGIGGKPTPIDYRDLLIYRSALNADEVAALHGGALLQASLDVYAPLADATFTPGKPVENRAQSLSKVVPGPSSHITHVER